MASRTIDQCPTCGGRGHVIRVSALIGEPDTSIVTRRCDREECATEFACLRTYVNGVLTERSVESK